MRFSRVRGVVAMVVMIVLAMVSVDVKTRGGREIEIQKVED